MDKTPKRALKSIWERTIPMEARRKFYHLRRNAFVNREESNTSSTRSPASSAGYTDPAGLVTIVVPVYKVEDYLDECVDSLLSQTYKALEIILVDDGSPDRCGEMCDAYADKFDSITVVHQPNGGLSNARNTGLRNANGEFVMFVDSDDVLSPSSVQDLLDSLKHHGADVATGNVTRFRGSRKWQAWNQTYSHAKTETWDGKSVAKVQSAVQLTEAPELLFDTTAWNKLFRTEFLRSIDFGFPEGKLYEDMLPMAQAFIAAKSIVKVPSVVYFYREREDNSSITQKRGQVVNLADKMEMVWRIEEELIRAGSGKESLDTIYFKVLEGDLPVYSPYLGSNDEFDELYLGELRKCWNKSSGYIKSRLALDRRSLFIHQLFGRDYLEAENESAWVANNFHEIPVLMRNGRVEVDVEFAPDHLGLLKDHDLIDMSYYVDMKQVVTDAYIDQDVLVLKGFAFIDHLPENVSSDLQLRLVTNDGVSVPLDHTATIDERANGYWRSGNASRAAQAFESVTPLQTIEMAVADSCNELTLEVCITAGSYRFVQAAKGYWRGGRIRLGGTSDAVGGARYRLPWQPWGDPLRLRRSRGEVEAIRFKVTNARIAVLVRYLPDTDLSGLRAVRIWDGHVVRMALGKAEGENRWWFEADLAGAPRRFDSGGNLNAWKFEYDSSKAEPAGTLAASTGWSLGSGSWDEWNTRSNSEGEALLHDSSTTLTVDRITPSKDGYVLHGRGFANPEHTFSGEMWSDKGAVYPLPEFQLDHTGSFELRIDCWESANTDSTTTWTPGEYRFRIVDAGTKGSKYRLRSGRSVAYGFPLENVGSRIRGRWHLISDTWELALGVAAPTTDAERGRYNVKRMSDRWKSISDDHVTPLDAAVFSVNMGSGTADSAVSIMKELSARKPHWKMYWAITDYSISVPENCIPLVRNTEMWFEVLSRAKLVVNNYGGISGYGNREFQRYLQTWHGTPLKYVGDSEFKSNPRWYARKRLIAQHESREWDWFVSPSPAFSELVESEFYFEGTILESGYPRNDELANADAETALAIKAQLGIDNGAKVLLYAPTFRDVSASGYSSPLVSYLDYTSLCDQLGPEWVVLLRGHSFNARADDKNRSTDRMIDVTKYPNVNDLIIASDLLVTDYSSIMFDYLVTRKPVIYFAPDLEEYTANRGLYFEYREILAGEVVSSQDELVRHVLSIDANGGSAVDDRYMRQVERFAPWDDGNASSRVVDAISDSLR